MSMIIAPQGALRPQESHRPVDPIPCQRCGAIDTPSIHPGKGPHAFKAVCAHCGAFIKWLSKYTPEEQQARQQRFAQQRKEHRHA